MKNCTVALMQAYRKNSGKKKRQVYTKNSEKKGLQSVEI